MEQKRFLTFIVLAAALFAVQIWATGKFKPKPKDAVPAAADADKADAEKPDAEAKKAAGPPKIVAPTEKVPDQWVTLGSADPNSEFRMLVTLTNRGAAIARMALNSPRYRDVENWEDRSGHLGHLEPIDADKKGGALVQVVGPGTPAGDAGMQAGDVITAIGDTKVKSVEDLTFALQQTTVAQQVSIQVLRGDKPQTLTATLGTRPLEVVKPEGTDPLSYLATLHTLDGAKIAEDKDELENLMMRTGNWKVLPQAKADEAAFQWTLPEQGLEIVKTYRLARVPVADAQDRSFPAYHLHFKIEIRNVGEEEHKLSYRLDGPTGLPTEGSWYASKISRKWFASVGLRDVVACFRDGNYLNFDQASATALADKPDTVVWIDKPLAYLGVDAQYFASVLLPEGEDLQQVQFAKELPIRVGPVPAVAADKKLTDVSSRIISKELTLKPGGKPFEQSFRIFAGPKSRDLLAHYGLSDLVYYGWFGWVAGPMSAVLRFFYTIPFINNYGIAIIMLTVLVRSGMFPVSRKQAMNMQKMQALAPEVKKIAEKHKDPLARNKAQNELYKKHNVRPLAGCLPVVLQLPIFMGLYRALMVNIDLRQAPLISDTVRWCSNLSAPDMAWYWERFLPTWLAGPNGWLGPYLNILPLITIALFLWQQKMFMPPPTDEQTAMQQKMMKYMMIFVSVMFFKVASGLCLYFIASSLWGIAERKLLPKATPGGPMTLDARSKVVATSAGTNGAKNGGKKKQRGKR